MAHRVLNPAPLPAVGVLVGGLLPLALGKVRRFLVLRAAFDRLLEVIGEEGTVEVIPRKTRIAIQAKALSGRSELNGM